MSPAVKSSHSEQSASSHAYVISDNLLYRTQLSRRTYTSQRFHWPFLIHSTRVCTACRVWGLRTQTNRPCDSGSLNENKFSQFPILVIYVLGFNLPPWSRFSWLPSTKYRGSTPNKATTASYQLLSNTLFASYATIRHSDLCGIVVSTFEAHKHTHTHMHTQVDSYVRVIRNREVWGLTLDTLPYVSVVHAVWFTFFSVTDLSIGRPFMDVLHGFSQCLQANYATVH